MFSGNSRACREIAEYCHQNARAYLKYKLDNSDNKLLKGYLRKEDLAWDCIAGLFERNKDGHFVIFSDFFENKNWDKLSENELKMALRRLVFSKVNDGIFRNFGAFDPSLRKIIRNIKLAVKDVENLQISETGSGKVLELSSDDLSNLPEIPVEFLEIRLSQRIGQKMTTPEIVKGVKQILESQQLYRQSIGLSQLAISIRKVYARVNDFVEEDYIDERETFMNGEVKMRLSTAVEEQKKDLSDTYVESGKMSLKRFETYFQAVEDIIKDNYVKENPHADTYFEHLQRYWPELTKQEYRSKHRQYLEYLIKKTRDHFIEKVKKDLKYSAGE